MNLDEIKKRSDQVIMSVIRNGSGQFSGQLDWIIHKPFERLHCQDIELVKKELESLLEQCNKRINERRK